MKYTKITILACLTVLAGTAFAGSNSAARPFVTAGTPGEAALKFERGATMTVRIGAADLAAVQAVHFDLAYDTDALEFVGFEAGDLFDDPLVLGPFVRTDKKVVDITIATSAGPRAVDRAEAGTVTFRVLDPARTDVALVSFQTGDENWKPDTQVSAENPVTLKTIPARTALLANVPNPFNPTTTIRYQLANTAPVRIDIYDVSGRHVKRLVDETREAGSHTAEWRGVDESGSAVSSGVYFYRFEGDGARVSRRMTLIR
ncbi:MAG: T9SS type A sorting domain-containing protein [Gemmatimonadetes bacterium]|nr:T9SS type A sorting domain-containing protein [Gemmatimonadota bacterium]